MTTRSRIEWTEHTWNPVTGCTNVSPGCKHCYARIMAECLKAMDMAGYENGFAVTLQPNRLSEPLRRRTPTMYFVNSMSDLFHERVLFDFVEQVFEVIARTPHHRYQIVTKRPKRRVSFLKGHTAPANVWLGVSVENRKHGLPRIDLLRQVNAAVRFLAIEPLLESLGKFELSEIHWVIVGGESGPGARPMHADWVRAIRDQCFAEAIPFFFKQWGMWEPDGQRRSKKANGRMLDGRIWDEFPEPRVSECCA
ncbi:MAG: phage Gp37/Gp68 family protein [Candidatus Binataceae bacterium]